MSEGDFQPLSSGIEEEVITLAHQQPWSAKGGKSFTTTPPPGGGAARNQFQAVNNPIVEGAASKAGHPRQSTYDQWNENKHQAAANQFISRPPLTNNNMLRQIATGLFLFLFFITFILSCVAISKANALQGSSVKSLEAQVVQLKGKVAQLQSAQSEVQTTADHATQNVATQTAQLNTLQTSVTTNDKAMNNKMTTMSEDIAALQAGSGDSGGGGGGLSLGCSSSVGVVFGGGEPVAYEGHYYQLVQVPYHMANDYKSGINFFEAQLDAGQRCHEGMHGYLVTITSKEEQDFVTKMLPTLGPNDKLQNFVGWIGATDIATEGAWKWVDGPEKGKKFFSGNYATGVKEPGMYVNWYCESQASNPDWPYCEPNGSNYAITTAGDQDCGSIYGNGQWNDIACTMRTEWFVVEYGDTAL